MFDYEPLSIPIAAAMPDGVAMLMRVPTPEDRTAAQGLERLLAWEEQQLAESMRGSNKIEFVCGRLALRTACRRFGADVGPILRDDRGAPVLPRDLTGSIAHRKGWVLAVVDWARNGTLGVDVESWPPSPSLAEHVLTVEEREQTAQLSDEARERAVLVRFALKEALFKALDPYARRYFGFRDVVIEERGASYRVALRSPEARAYKILAFVQWWGEWVFASTRVQLHVAAAHLEAVDAA